MSRPKGFPKSGGRKAGVPNKSNQSQTEKIQQLCIANNIDPLEALLKLAVDEKIDISLRISVLKEIAQYVYPKRKSIEISADVEFNTAPQIQIYLPDNGTSKN